MNRLASMSGRALSLILALLVLGEAGKGAAQSGRAGRPGDVDKAKAELRAGIARQQAGDLYGAESAYERAIALSPDLAEAHGNLCSVRLSRKNTDGAIDSCRRALALQPSLDPARYNLAQALMAKERFGEAAEAYRELARTRPQDPKVQLGLGSATFAMKDYASAVAAFSQAVALDPRLFEAHYNLAVVYESLGKRQEALRQYRQCMGLLPPGASRDRIGEIVKRMDAESGGR